MPIPASQIVEVNPRIIASSGDGLEFNGLLLSKNIEIPSDKVLSFNDETAVSDYFGELSTEAKLAQIYFLGYQNASKSPSTFFIAPRIDTARAAWLRGAELKIKLNEIAILSNASIDFNIMQTSIMLEDINFTGIQTWSDIAKILENALKSKAAEIESPLLQSALEGLIIEYISYRKAFKISLGLHGESSIISYCSGDLADLLALSIDTGAEISNGIEAQSENTNMEAITRLTQNWVNFTCAWQTTMDEVVNFATWASSKKVAYLYLYADDDSKLLTSGSEETIAFALKEANISSVAGQYNSVEYCAFIMSIGACIDYSKKEGAITTAFKAQSGLNAVVDTEAKAVNLIENCMNFVGDYATRNDNFIFNYPGQMFGTYKWIDTYWNAIWLNNALQLSLLNGLVNSPRTPYSAKGYALVRAWLQDPINQALNNNVIEAGISLSESQKAQINREAGKQIASEIENIGYYVQILDASANQRVNRESPTVQLWYSYGGSINTLLVSSTALV